MKLFSLVAILAVATATICGCGALRGGRTIVKFDEGTKPVVTETPASGTYALYSMTDVNPKVTVVLEEGDKLGFKASETGQVIAVAGDREIPLNASETYYWKQQS